MSSSLKDGRYTLQSSWTNGPNGNWCFAYDTQTGQEVYVKEFFKWRYPSADMKDSPNARRKIENCDKFCRRIMEINDSVNDICGTSGSVVIAQDFFRDGLCIYKVNKKIDFKNWPASEVRNHLTVDQIDELMMMICCSVQALHSVNIVHCDLKPENIFIVEHEDGMKALLTDFDDSFFMNAPPPGTEVVCSPEYMSPEMGLHVVRECDTPPIPIAAESDIFALGLMYHQYLTGEMPGFDEKRGQLWSALLQGDEIILSDKLDPAHRALICRMLHLNPLDRPNGKDVIWEIQRIRRLMKKQYTITLMNNKKPVSNKEIKVFSVETGRDGKIVRQLIAAQKTDSDGSLLLKGLSDTGNYVVEYGRKEYGVMWTGAGNKNVCLIETGKKKYTVRMTCKGDPTAGLNVSLCVCRDGSYTSMQAGVTNEVGECVFYDVPDEECYIHCEGQFTRAVWSKKRDFEMKIAVQHYILVVQDGRPAPNCVFELYKQSSAERKFLGKYRTQSSGIAAVGEPEGLYDGGAVQYRLVCGDAEYDVDWTADTTCRVNLRSAAEKAVPKERFEKIFNPPHRNLVCLLRRVSENAYEMRFVGGRTIQVNAATLALYGLEEYSRM